MVCFIPPKQPINLSGWKLPDRVLYDILKLSTSGGIGTHRAATACRTVSIFLRRYPELRHVRVPLDFESVQEAVDRVPGGATVMNS